MFDQDEMFEDLRQSMMRAEEENQIKGEEYNRLLADPFMGEIKEGDKVLVRASMIGRGHHWKMIEILVEKVSPNGQVFYGGEVGDKGFCGLPPSKQWIPRELLIDIVS